ncbi:lantibiotic dehydratase [Micromonospora aurantiaca (nom. illeg.)]|uniref:lantibiotic dehydratase n=1 Tax=Micromonospora aurantiaca (nom. illeg.) TaxID=47850 RepID=UPI0036683FC0
MFTTLDAAMLRTAAYPLEPPTTWPDLTHDDVDQWRAWLTKVWSQHDVADAIAVASPVLADRVQRELCDGPRLDARQVRRLVVSTIRYLLRMTSRATPFGLFAGVAPIRLDAATASVRWGTSHRTVARPEPAWMASRADQLESLPEVQDLLPVVVNDLAFVRGDRLVVPCQPHPDGPPAEITVKHSPIVADAIRIARTPLPLGELAARAAERYPGWEQGIRRLIGDLLTRKVLISALRPPMTAVDPLGYLTDQLALTGVDRREGSAPLVPALRAIRHDLGRRDGRARAARRMTRVAAEPASVAVDLRVDCAAAVPASVARAAEEAAALLVRLNPAARGETAWVDYQARFLDRYGPGAVVPVRDLVSDGGLGFPADYRGSPYEQRPPAVMDRDRLLLALVQRTAMRGADEIALDERLVEALSGDPAAVQAPPHTELSFQVHAPSRDAVDRGDFDLVVVAAHRAAGTSTGRFLHLLDPPELERFRRAYAHLPTVDADALAVQMSAPPLLLRTEQLARTPAVLPRLLSLGEHPTAGPERITLDDLAVTGDARRLQLLSLSAGRPVEVTALHSVEFTNATQPLVRFLCEVSRARTAACRPFVWAAASKLPFLPRVRHGRLVLSSARWNLTPVDVAPAAASWPQWRESLARWSEELRLPATVCVGGDDQRLRLDLGEDAHLHLLRAHLERHGHATLHEAPAPAGYGWIDGHAHEIVVPLASTVAPTWPAIPRPRAARARVVDRDHGHLPGFSTWLHAKLYGHPGRQTTVLTDRLRELLDDCPAPPDGWWFLRYRDPDPHLRLRIRLPHPDGYGPVAAQVGRWVAELRRDGLISHLTFDSYQPETGRYGTGPAMAAAETVFAADSAAAVAQLVGGRTATVAPEAITAASMTAIATGLTGSVTAGMRWLVDNVPAHSPTPLPRDAQRDAVRLADPADDWAALLRVDGGREIRQAWSQRRTTLLAYRQQLAQATETDPHTVLASLLHLHHIRMAGINHDAEQTVHRLARAAALAWTVRTGRTPR